MNMSDTPRTDSMVKTVKGWKQQARAGNLAFLCRKLERENNQLRAQLAEARADKERLDWLEETADGLDWQLKNWGTVNRQSIDAAIAKYAARSATP